MTDQQYYECYEQLVNVLAQTGKLDGDMFYSIYEGKIRPIVRNVFSEYAGLFTSFDAEDVYQDIFIKIWTRCVGAYFMNDKYEKDAAWFLGWCKIVAKNHVTSLLRRSSLKTADTIDDPDHPLVVTDGSDPSRDVAARDSVKTVFIEALALNCKPEMKLTWFGVYLSVWTGEAEDRIDANRVFIARYSGKTLGELFDYVGKTLVRTVPETEDLVKKLGKELGAVKDGRAKRDAALGDLLGDDPVGKISDWIYKVNKKLGETLPLEV